MATHKPKNVSDWAKEKNAKNKAKADRGSGAPVIDFENLSIDDDQPTLLKEVKVDNLGNALNQNTEIEVKVVLSKEENKQLKLEAKAAKEAKKNGAAAEASGPRKATKVELKLIKQKIKKRRYEGEEEVYTDEELELAGFLVE